MSRLVQRSATGVAVARNANAPAIVVYSITLTAAAAAATVTIDDSAGGAGTDLISLAAPIGGSVQWHAGDVSGVIFLANVHATLAGAGALLTLETN
jgi:hypothetical protein